MKEDQLVLYNTLSRKKEVFEPIEKGIVKMYCCGPTVYGLLHVGNFRGPVFYNMLRNWLEYLGYEVRFALNYTDVDDKIIQRSNDQGIKAEQLSENFIQEFQADYRALKLKAHTFNPKVSDFMPQIIQMISDLVANDSAYVTSEGEVLFSVASFKDYGKLSGRTPDELKSGHRIEVSAHKRNPLDFALWKPAKPGEPSWNSPWSDGRPGWHIECSAMSRALLGDQLDIHGGGLDLEFPHHENEIAQSQSCTGHTYAKYWVHNQMINFGDQKMSKSVGNIVTARAFMERFHPEILKFVILSNHYRSIVDLSDEQVDQSIAALARIYKAIESAQLHAQAHASGELLPQFQKQVERSRSVFAEGLNEDLNTPVAFSAVFDLVREWNALSLQKKMSPELRAVHANEFLNFMSFVDSITSLFGENPQEFLKTLDQILIRERAINVEYVQKLVDERSQARASKDFVRSDKLRAELSELGIEISDAPTGTVWEVKK